MLRRIMNNAHSQTILFFITFAYFKKAFDSIDQSTSKITNGTIATNLLEGDVLTPFLLIIVKG